MTTYDNLISWVEEIKNKNNSSATSLCILKDNKVVLEYYSGFHSNTLDAKPITEHSQFNVASARKSYLGLAIAYAIYEGKIGSLDDYASDYFLDVDQELLGKTTIRHLVTHSHGLHEQENGSLYREFEPGESWAYRGINVMMMTKLLKSLYGKPYTDLLKERVFEPLLFTETAWQTEEKEDLVHVIYDPSEAGKSAIGSSNDGMQSNLHVSTREFAYWGNLHLNEGNVYGKQIVPRDVIKLATKAHSPIYQDDSLPQNGLFWYVQHTPATHSEIGNRVAKGFLSNTRHQWTDTLSDS
ncbi:CubicO group peptidase (beta-lactamase class C family) [Salirhabdus euzebyi]|uniref:CubicO group peptidase (Beta-lactamase class C family) n=1 Tax=Salirhabdus euzebyi TaxID=394506 RepID=A0A841PV38_9BACI|nr:CubicO group peptidase (beta-lactamase class C family) [Salirhabdus euzebyi]